jgi:hypothetical protein
VKSFWFKGNNPATNRPALGFRRPWLLAQVVASALQCRGCEQSQFRNQRSSSSQFFSLQSQTAAG